MSEHAYCATWDRDRRPQGEQQDSPRELSRDEGSPHQVHRLHGRRRIREDVPHHQAGREAPRQGGPGLRHRRRRHRQRRLQKVRGIRAGLRQLQHRQGMPSGRQSRQEETGVRGPRRLRCHLHRERREPRLPRRLPARNRPEGRGHLRHGRGRHGQEAPRHLPPLRCRHPQ